MPWGLDIAIARRGDEAVVTLTGTLDRATAHELARAVSGASESEWRVVLDLRAVTFMDLGGLKAVLEAQTTARARRRDLKVIPGPPNVQRVFELTRTDDALCFVRQSPNGLHVSARKDGMNRGLPRSARDSREFGNCRS